MISSWKCRPRNSSGRFRLTESRYQMRPPRLQQIRRVARIELLIGGDVIEEACDEVYAKFESEVDPELWDMFTSGEKPPRDENGVPIVGPTGANKGERGDIKSERDDIRDLKALIAVVRRWALE